MSSFPKNGSLQQTVRQIINHKYADFVVIVLILTSVVVLVMEQFLEKRGIYGKAGVFDVINHIITGFFIIELGMRWIAQKRKSRFFRMYWLDIIAVLAPMFRSLRFLRILRLLRMFRLGQLLNRRFSAIHSWVSFGLLRHFWLFVILLTVVVAGAISFHLVENAAHVEPRVRIENKVEPQAHRSFGESIWLVLFTVVGGEPLTGEPAKTPEGRLILLFVMIVGLTTFAALTGIITAVMINRLRPRMDAGDLDLLDLEDHIVICGWNRAMTLLIGVLQNSDEYRNKAIVLVAEYNEGEPESLLDTQRIPAMSMLYVVRGDFTRTDVLVRVGIERASEAIVLADKCGNRSDQDRDARTILAALLIEKLNPNIFTCVEILNRNNAAHIKFAGVEEILVTDDYAGPILANSQRIRGLIQMLDELFNPAVGNQFYRIECPSSWVGRTVGEIFPLLKSEYNAILVSLEIGHDKAVTVEVNPDNARVLSSRDRLVVIAQRYPVLVE